MLTFKINGYNGIPHGKYRAALAKLDFEEGESGEVSYTIFSQDGKTPFERSKCSLKSVVDFSSIENIADKGKLSSLMSRYMAREYKMNTCFLCGKLKLNDVVVFKPTGRSAFGGRGIQVLTKGQKFECAVAESYVACSYIQDLTTFKGRKFHLRVYLFVTTWGTWKLFPKYRIITAKDPYIKGDWNNKDIHDTHLESTDEDYFFFEGADLYFERTDREIQEICDELMKHVNPRPYPEADAAYEMLGLDFLVREDKSVVLLEVNDNAGIKCVEVWSEYKREVLEMELSLAIEYFQL